MFRKIHTEIIVGAMLTEDKQPGGHSLRRQCPESSPETKFYIYSYGKRIIAKTTDE